MCFSTSNFLISVGKIVQIAYLCTSIVSIMKHIAFFVCCLLALFACSDDADWEEQLVPIRQLSEASPQAALCQLDSLTQSMHGASRHVRQQSRLLRIRLCDKADILPESDTEAKELVQYFDHNGDDAERQEAHYYAGSVYRDLRDTPRALEHFLQAMAVAEQSDHCDSLLLRNTYSNLSYLFNSVQDNQNYLLYAQKEYQISLSLQRLEVTSIIHLATAYLHADSCQLALQYFDQALLRLEATPSLHDLYILLDYYSYIQHQQQADRCMALIGNLGQSERSVQPDMELLSLGRYYQLKGDYSSAIGCYETVMDKGRSMEAMYDASRRLITLYHDTGDAIRQNLYAIRFVQLCDTLNLGERQEMAATVNNLYRYQRDKDEEQQILQTGESYRMWAIGISVLALLVVLTGGLVYERKKGRMMRELLSLSGQMTELKDERQKLQDEQQKLQEEIERQKQQNSAFIRLLHQSEFESKADDIFTLLKRASEGRHTMTSENWRQLYQAVDEENPSFRDMILQHLGEFTDQQMQVCYLLRIGMARQDIQHITNLSRVTVWRWAKRFEWAEMG